MTAGKADLFDPHTCIIQWKKTCNIITKNIWSHPLSMWNENRIL